MARSESAVLTIPNALSFLRICLIPVIVWLYRVEQSSLWAGGILILSGITDVVDGFIARRFNMTSSVGKVLDPAADKLTQVAMLFCLLPRFPWVIFPIVLMVAKEIFMSVTGAAIIKRTGVVLGADWHGKAATCLLYGTILLHMCWYEIPAIVSILSAAACGLMIAASFVLYGKRNMRYLRNPS